MHLSHFLLEEIFLVKKQNNGGGCEILVITDAVEQVKTFMHSVLWCKERDHVKLSAGFEHEYHKQVLDIIRTFVMWTLGWEVQCHHWIALLGLSCTLLCLHLLHLIYLPPLHLLQAPCHRRLALHKI